MFTHDVELSLIAATTLVNTLPDASHSGEDEFTTRDQLDAWFEGEGFTGVRLHTEAPSSSPCARCASASGRCGRRSRTRRPLRW